MTHSEKNNIPILQELEELLISRKKELPENSYTTSLFKMGSDTISQKVGEEAVEVILAAKNDNHEDTVSESADLIFHLLVLLVENEIPLRDVLTELENRRS